MQEKRKVGKQKCKKVEMQESGNVERYNCKKVEI